jgi:hypothetical protein
MRHGRCADATASEQEKRRGVRRMKTVATGFLLAATLI